MSHLLFLKAGQENKMEEEEGAEEATVKEKEKNKKEYKLVQ